MANVSSVYWFPSCLVALTLNLSAFGGRVSENAVNAESHCDVRANLKASYGREFD